VKYIWNNSYILYIYSNWTLDRGNTASIGIENWLKNFSFLGHIYNNFLFTM